MDQFQLSFFTIFSLLISCLTAQQMYSENKVLDCNNTDETGPSPAFLYSCNGEKQSCQAFLIFRSQPLYDSAAAISNLVGSDLLELASINNVPSLTLLPPSKEVIVPVNCSCLGKYYQANTSYVTQSVYDTYFTIANNTYQGLSTCDILMVENSYGELDLVPGLKLQVPLRCACPTGNQTMKGTKFLLTYLVTWGDTIPKVSERFNVSARSVAFANGFSVEDPTLYPFTTLLIPLPTEPLSSQIRTPNPPVVSPPTVNQTSGNSKKRLFIGIGSGLSLIVLCFVLLMVCLHQKRSLTDRVAWKHRGGEKKSGLPKDLLAGIASVDEVLKFYEFKELAMATKNFSPRSRLSDSVYHGVLRGKVIAVKKIGTDVSKEVTILNKINHFNLISLYGVSEYDGVFYLVYEFMENGSLKDWIHQKSCSEFHSWNHRIQIALDVANGLHYLHDFADPAYVHKNINSSNILLNKDLRAKIANFSLARSAERGENAYSSTCTHGTKGYLAPEYLEANMVTPKMDTYAFGVIVLELITGREAIIEQDGEEILLSDAILSIMNGGNVERELVYLIDPRLQIKETLGYIIDQSELVLRMVRISIGCLEHEPASRLSMAEVVSALMKIQLDVQKSEPLHME